MLLMVNLYEDWELTIELNIVEAREKIWANFLELLSEPVTVWGILNILSYLILLAFLDSM